MKRISAALKTLQRLEHEESGSKLGHCLSPKTTKNLCESKHKNQASNYEEAQWPSLVQCPWGKDMI